MEVLQRLGSAGAAKVGTMGRWIGGLGPLDRLGVRVGPWGDRDRPWLLLLGLGDPELEHAAIEVRLHTLGVDAVGQCQ